MPRDLENLRILVVDDDDDARELLLVALAKRRAHVVVASSAAEALQVFEREPPDILVSDIGMPFEDGYALVRRIRALTDGRARTPAIAVTAYTAPSDRARSLAAGFDRHLAKPVDFDVLADAIVALTVRRQTS